MLFLRNSFEHILFQPLLESDYSILKRMSLQTREMRILATVALAFAVLGALICCHFWFRRAKIISNTSVKPNPEDAPSFSSPQTPRDEKVSTLSKEVFRPSVNVPINVPILPPVTPDELKMKSSAVFKQLALKTEAVETLPYTPTNCRFDDILCPKDTLVEVKGKTESLYLHANHVDLDGIPMILTQYPLSGQFPLFWSLCENAPLVVDLTNDKDVKTGIQRYAPELKKSLKCGGLSISCENRETLPGLLKAFLYTYRVDDEDSSGKSFEVKRIHYEAWDDYQGISETDMDLLVRYMEQYSCLRGQQPVIIHCRVGVGRSGAVAVAYALRQLVKRKQVDSSNARETINRLILEGRKKRGPGFVQNPKQLQAIWNWAEKDDKMINIKLEDKCTPAAVNNHPEFSLSELGMTTGNEIIDFLGKYGNQLKSLNLGKFNCSDDEFEAFIKLCPQIQHLFVSSDKMTDQAIANLKGMLLTSVDFSFCNELTDKALEHLKGMPLTSIDFSYCDKLTDKALEHLKGMQLTSIDFSWCKKLTDKALEHLKGMPLTSIDFSWCKKLTDKALVNLEGMPLTRIHISSSSELTDKAMEHLKGMQLTSIDFSWCKKLTDKALENFEGMPLKQICFMGCRNITDNALKNLRCS